MSPLPCPSHTPSFSFRNLGEFIVIFWLSVTSHIPYPCRRYHIRRLLAVVYTDAIPNCESHEDQANGLGRRPLSKIMRCVGSAASVSRLAVTPSARTPPSPSKLLGIIGECGDDLVSPWFGTGNLDKRRIVIVLRWWSISHALFKDNIRRLCASYRKHGHKMTKSRQPYRSRSECLKTEPTAWVTNQIRAAKRATLHGAMMLTSDEDGHHKALMVFNMRSFIPWD